MKLFSSKLKTTKYKIRNKLPVEKLNSLIKWNSDTKQIFGSTIKTKSTPVIQRKSREKYEIAEYVDYDYIENCSSAVYNNNYKDAKTGEVKNKETNSDLNICYENLSKTASCQKNHSNLNNAFNIDLLNFPLFRKDYPNNESAISSMISTKTLFPSVSRILQNTMSEKNKMILKLWEEQMIKTHGLSGFERIKQDTFINGSNLHSSIQSFLKKDSAQNISSANEGHWNSVIPILKNINNVNCTEFAIKHNVLKYKGILDCVADYNDKTYLIDWKTSKKRKTTLSQTYDNPLQLAAYLGALNHSSTSKQIENCLLVIIYEDGSLADLHKMDSNICSKYWLLWLQRLNEFYKQDL